MFLKNFLIKKNIFILFTDVVKFYEIVDAKNREINDINARGNFRERAFATENINKFKKELKYLAPTNILCLGKKTYNFVKEVIPNKVISNKDIPNKNIPNKIIVSYIRHPARGGYEQAQQKVKKILNQALACCK